MVFCDEVFEVFERYKTSIDMITTSEVAVSLTIDDTFMHWTRLLRNYWALARLILIPVKLLFA